MRLTVARLAVVLLLTSLLIIHLVCSISRHYTGRQSNQQFTSSRPKKSQKEQPTPPRPPPTPIPIPSFPQLHPLKEWWPPPIQQRPQPLAHVVQPAHSSKNASISSTTTTNTTTTTTNTTTTTTPNASTSTLKQPYTRNLQTLENPKPILPQRVVQPSNR